MKATGIVRRIDDLGRVVIPKEIRSASAGETRWRSSQQGTARSSLKSIRPWGN